MLIAKDKEGGAAGYYWPEPGASVDIPDELAFELLHIGHGGFSEVHPTPKAPAEKPAKKAPVKREEKPAGDLREAVQVATGNK